MASEAELIATLKEIFAVEDPNLLVGIGDDGAVVQSPSQNLVMASDMAVEGVHFKREWSTLREIGAKVSAANFADIFAMGGLPKYLLVSAGLPKGFTIAEIQELAHGIKGEADLVGAGVIGGDISSSSHLVISISVFGEVQIPIMRSGAKLGDKVIISSLPGKSAAGLKQLEMGLTSSKFISAHKRPVLDYEMAINFTAINNPNYLVNAMCDVSDGLISELKHIADASKVSIKLDSKLISEAPGFSELSDMAAELKVDVWQWILSGGEDHVFVATTCVKIPEGAIVIGVVESDLGVTVQGLPDLKSEGFKHF